MNILNQVSTGASSQDGQRIVIAGSEGLGKTTLGCGAPGVLLVPLEMGSGSMRVAKTPMLNSWEEVEQLCKELIAAAQSGKLQRGQSIVWDSATALERFIDNYTIRSDPTYKAGNPTKLTMATAHGAYGKAYDVANETFQRWTRYLDELAIYGGINSIVTCHVFANVVLDPASGEFHSWDLLLHSPKNGKTYGKREFITQWADMIGFLHEPYFVMKTEKGQVMQKAISSNQGRLLAVDRQPGWIAKNRYGLDGTISIPKPAEGGNPAVCWNALAHSVYTRCGIDLYNRSV